MTIRSILPVCLVIVSTSAWAQTALPPGVPGNAQGVMVMKDTGPPPPPRPLPHPTTEAQLREFLQITDASNRVHRDLTNVLANVRARLPPYFPADVLAEIETNFKALDLVQLELPWYQAYLSEQDMGALLAFYRTEAGKHYAAVQGQLLVSAQVALSGHAQSIVQSALMKHKDEIDAAKRAAEGQTPPAIPTPK